jgi:porphobilinogen deaminase
MYQPTDLKKGTVCQIDGKPYRVVEYGQKVMGRGGSIVNVKLKNLIDGSVIPKTFKGQEKIETAEVNTELLDKINALSDDNSDREAVAERTFLKLTGGGCHAPVGAHCVTKENGDLRMVVLFGNDDCSRILRIEVTGTDSEAVGHEAARMLGLE